MVVRVAELVGTPIKLFLGGCDEGVFMGEELTILMLPGMSGMINRNGFLFRMKE